MKNNKWNMSNVITRNALRSFLILFLVCLVLLSRNTTALADTDFSWTQPASTAVYIYVDITCTASGQGGIEIWANNQRIAEGDRNCGSWFSYDLAAYSTERPMTISLKPVGNNFPQSIICRWMSSVDLDCDANYSYSSPHSPLFSSPSSPPLPEDQIGAYYPDSNPRTYAWFFDEGTCLQYIEDPDMCVWPRVHN